MTASCPRCNYYDIPKPGTQPRIDPQCLLDYGHDGAHIFVESRVPKQEDEE